MRVVAAPDKFRGTLTAVEAAAAIAAAAGDTGWTCTRVPMADGGEGTLDALGGGNQVTRVTGPLGTPVDASWRLVAGVAVIEAAQAAGLTLAGGRAGNDPERATTAGVGELVVEAVRRGAYRVIVSVGGSATTDGGAGAVEAMLALAADWREVELVVASDVDCLFVDAAATFGPQKGADAGAVARLGRRLERTADRYLAELGVDVRAVPGAGAAGGLAGGLHALGARIVRGFDLVAAEVGLAARMQGADLVLTGEGQLDASSFDGKVVGGTAALADSAGVEWRAVCGDVAAELRGDPRLLSMTALFGAAALTDAWACLRQAAAAMLREA